MLKAFEGENKINDYMCEANAPVTSHVAAVELVSTKMSEGIGCD